MPSLWEERPEAERQAIESRDAFAQLRNKLRDIGQARGEWAGIPIPIDGERLIIEKSYSFAVLGEIGQKDDEEPKDIKLRNVFYSTKYRCNVCVLEKAGRIWCVIDPAFHHLKHDLRTLGCSVAWGIEQESRALHLLATLIPHHAFKMYLLTGMFLESSKRSGKTYLFRKLKPTAVLAPDPKRDEMRVLCTLCQHPIGYYAGSWAGAMCPTDDVIAHLTMMRADEALYWKRSNQHPPHRPEAGL